jgi:Co/Zn/Cd efflux system component
VVTTSQRRVLVTALSLNATMFIIGLAAGTIAQSSGLIADSFDMLADAIAYTVALVAVKRGEDFKARAATWSGSLLMLLGLGVILDVLRRTVVGNSPEGHLMLIVASVSLVVNSTVLYLLSRVRHQGVHLNATWIFTRADVIANIAVIFSALVVLLTRFRDVDLIVGAGIGAYILKEAFDILYEAREARDRAAR